MKDYIEGLNATRYIESSDSRAAHEGTNLWVGRFAAAGLCAVAYAEDFKERIQAIQLDWHRRLESVRSASAVELLLKKLPAMPVLTIQSAAELIERSMQATNEAVARLVEAGVLVQAKAGQRNRVFEAPDIITAFTNLERRLASPQGDTRIAQPVRSVPYSSS